MNSTLSQENIFTTSENFNIGLGGMLLISEVLPMLKKHKGNGIIDTLLCIIKGSSCFLKKITDTLEKTKPDIELDKV